MREMPLLIAATRATKGPKVPVRNPGLIVVDGLVPGEHVKIYGDFGLIAVLEDDGEHNFPQAHSGCSEVWAEKVGTSSSRLYVWVT